MKQPHLFEKTSDLLEISHELSDIASALAVLSWDQETYMPSRGVGPRSMQLATLSGIYHEKLTDPRVGRMIARAKRTAGLNVYEKALVRETEREYNKAIKLPKKLVKEISEATSRSFDNWRTAKEKNRFALFAPDLEKVLGLQVKVAGLLREKDQSLYDAMLDNYEPGLTEVEISRVFEQIKLPLSKLASQLAITTHNADLHLTNKSYKKTDQWLFGMEMLKKMGFDLEAGRQDVSAHPFTTSFGITDVRITTWENETDLRPSLFATIHEAGHALYEQGVDLRLERTGLAGGTGLVMHESQSRLWENMVGRSAEFWTTYYPQLQRLFPALKKMSMDEFTKAINVVKPSLVRVEADEVTYGLHIILRFELEREMVGGKLKLHDLPEVWSQKMSQLLGIQPDNDREGALQDVHWSHGSFGYFPTYLLGTMTAAQLWKTIKSTTTIESDIASGNLSTLTSWLRSHIHQYGRTYSSKELTRKITGDDLNAHYLVEYLEDKFIKLYTS